MTYQLLLTTLGQQKLASAASAGGQPVRITEFAVGQGVNVDFSKRLDQQVLVSKRYQGNVESVASTAVAGQYEITCIVPQDQGGWAIREIGLIDSEGSLIWVGQVPEVQKPVASSTAAVDYRIKAVISIDNPDVNLVIDANVVTATQSWVANNFVSNPRFAQFLTLAYPYGHKYWSHSKTNPKPLFDAMFGFETHWRRLEGIGLVAVKDGDAYIGQPMLTLGQRGNTELATTERPHAYPIYTSYLFERYDPSTVVETVWKVVANKTSINEGDAVRFTVTANNLPDGQILNWSVKEGALNSSSNDIATPEKTDSGTVILTNGQAIINFTTTPDDNAEEPQKHVRLSVGAPANLAINVPINDAGHNETVMHISQSTTKGIDLAEYYKAQSGSYPSSKDTVRFVVDANVDIIAPSTTIPALTEGANWPTDASIIVENRGRILGRGGDGGRSAYIVGYLDDNNSSVTAGNIVASQKGGDGGTCIKSINKSITVENYSLIAGGGGGGGGQGAWSQTTDFVTVGGGGGTGGGAPLGKRSPNEGTLQMYLIDPSAQTPRYTLPADERVYYTILLTTDHTTLQGVGITNEQYDYNVTTGKSRSIYVPLNANQTQNLRDDFEGVYYARHNGSTTSISHPLMMSSNATIDTPGVGGYGGGETQHSVFINITNSIDLSVNHGGDGGEIGGAGRAGVVSKIFGGTTSKSPANADILKDSSDGGLAGYIKEGSVTITNYSNGVTKGR